MVDKKKGKKRKESESVIETFRYGGGRAPFFCRKGKRNMGQSKTR